MNTLDTEALELFHAGTSQIGYWDEFTDRQRDHWRAVARKARELHAPIPTRHEIAEVVLNHWARDWDDPRYPAAVRCGAEGCDWEGRFPGDISEHVADIISSANAHDLSASVNDDLPTVRMVSRTITEEELPQPRRPLWLVRLMRRLGWPA